MGHTSLGGDSGRWEGTAWEGSGAGVSGLETESEDDGDDEIEMG
jgi:hypothetical protein